MGDTPSGALKRRPNNTQSAGGGAAIHVFKS
jgi:hypothetical protein